MPVSPFISLTCWAGADDGTFEPQPGGDAAAGRSEAEKAMPVRPDEDAHEVQHIESGTAPIARVMILVYNVRMHSLCRKVLSV